MKLIEKTFIDILKTIYGKENVIKFNPGKYSISGVSDLLIFWKHKKKRYEIWCEIKIKKAFLSSQQVLFLKKVNSGIVLHVEEKYVHISIFNSVEKNFLKKLEKEMKEILFKKTREEWQFKIFYNTI
jgi:hypothetical protein